MVVNIEQIREKGLTLHEPLSVEFLDAALAPPGQDTGFRATRPSTLSATLRKVSGGVLLEGRLTVHVRGACKRCLVDVQRDVPVEFVLNLVPQALAAASRDEDEEEARDSGQGEAAGSFDLEDADEEVFDGKHIDLDPIVREQVLLALPMSVVCREECRGLCAQCGQNLNEAQCGHETKVLDPRLAALRDIKLS
jgi:uncharacterized protein